MTGSLSVSLASLGRTASVDILSPSSASGLLGCWDGGVSQEKPFLCPVCFSALGLAAVRRATGLDADTSVPARLAAGQSVRIGFQTLNQLLLLTTLALLSSPIQRWVTPACKNHQRFGGGLAKVVGRRRSHNQGGFRSDGAALMALICSFIIILSSSSTLPPVAAAGSSGPLITQTVTQTGPGSVWLHRR